MSPSLLLAGLCLSITVAEAWDAPAAAEVFNGTFDEDRGPFIVPLGWTPYGEAGYGGRWEENWHAEVSNVLPGDRAGLYQVIPNVSPGGRYRLTAKARCGSDQLAVRIGVVPHRLAHPEETIWSEPHQANAWETLEATFTAGDEAVVVMLDLENTNEQWQLLEAGAWEDVRLDRLSEGEAVEAPRAKGRPAPASAASDVIACMANLWSLARPKPGVRTLLAGTHHPDPNSNQDFNRVEGHTEIDGEAWTVLKSWDGPGALVRLWMTNFKPDGLLRIEFDGKVIYTGRLRSFFGTAGPFSWPLQAKTTGAYLSQFPMPFRRSCRLLVREAGSDRFYWQANVQLYDTAVEVKTLSVPFDKVTGGLIHTIQNQWLFATIDPKPMRKDAPLMVSEGVMDLAPGAGKVLWSHDGPATVARLFIDPPVETGDVLQGLRIRATWDGAMRPQVDAPLGLFFGVGYERTICRGLLLGMAPGVGGYCYFPMPMKTGGRIELINTTGETIRGIRYGVHHVPEKAEAVSPLRFHAITVQDDRAGAGELFVPVEVEGRGHFVGLSAAMQYGSDQNAHFLEGDEYVWVDGEERPSHMGTGTEDYFSCGWYFFAGPMTLPVAGAPTVKQDPEFRVSAYRLHVGDWIPFARSFKFGLEVGDSMHAQEYGRYTMVSYVYLGEAE